MKDRGIGRPARGAISRTGKRDGSQPPLNFDQSTNKNGGSTSPAGKGVDEKEPGKSGIDVSDDNSKNMDDQGTSVINKEPSDKEDS